MVASGLPVRNGDKHALEIAIMALDLLDGSSKFGIPHRYGNIVINFRPIGMFILNLKRGGNSGIQ